jgi:hypothetical protein
MTTLLEKIRRYLPLLLPLQAAFVLNPLKTNGALDTNELFLNLVEMKRIFLKLNYKSFP